MKISKHLLGPATVFLLLITNKSIAQTNTFPSSGNVGIGTASPATKLHVDDASSGGVAMFVHQSDGTNGYGMKITAGGTGTGRYAFRVNDINDATTFFTIQTATGNVGNVGIGTTTPGAKLTALSGGGLTGLIRNEDATNGYGLAVESEGTASTRYAFTVRNLAGTNTYFHVSTVSGQVGYVGIGTTSPTEKLSVNGNVYANGNISSNGNITTKKLVVTQIGWSDYVFDKDYKLRSLYSLESYIKQNKHLPEIPSAKEVEEKGISVGDNQALLLKKIEELSLYVIDQQKQLNQLKKQINKK